MAGVGKLFTETLQAGAKAAPKPKKGSPKPKAVPGPHQVNIGLKVGEDGVLSPDEALAALQAQGIKVQEAIVVTPAQVGDFKKVWEDTLVVKMDRPLTDTEAHQVAVDLNQEAIVQKSGNSPKNVGTMHGPNHQAWGAFNDDYFVGIDPFRARRTPAKDQEIGVLDWAAERYPETADPVPTWKADKQKWFEAKDHSPEEATLQEARRRVQADMDANGYDPMFPPEDRFAVPEGTYDMSQAPNTDSLRPQTKPSMARHSVAANAPESIAKLRDAYIRAGHDPNAVDWYHMGQLHEQFVNRLGPEEGSRAFDEKFAQAMAATTGGADPGTNFLSAMYGNFQREAGLPIPRRPDGSVQSNQIPSPVGGRYIGTNMDHYDKMIMQGQGLGLAHPKRSNFQWNFKGETGRPTLDEQMSSVWGMKAPPPAAYGAYMEPVQKLADEFGVEPVRFQEVAWAGLKGSEGKPMISHVNDSVERTSRISGRSPQDVVNSGIIDSRMPLLAGAGTAVGVAGVLATPEREQPLAAIGGRLGTRAAAIAEEAAQESMKKIGSAAGEFRRGGHDGATALRRMEDQIERIQGLHNLPDAEKARLMDSAWAEYQNVQKAAGEEGGRLMTRPEGQIPGDAPMLEDLRADQAGDLYRADRPYTPGEAEEVTEFMRLDREMREVPPEFITNNSPGKHHLDGMEVFRPENHPGRTYTADEIANYENPHPDKEMMSVGGVAGSGYVLADDAEDPGVLANPTIQDSDGRVSAFEPLVRGALSAGTTLAGLPGFVRGVARDLTGKAVGGLAATGQAGAGVLANELGFGDSYLPSQEQLQGTLDANADIYGTVDEDNAIMQQLQGLIEGNPVALEILQGTMDGYEKVKNKAYEINPRLGLWLESTVGTMMEVL